MNVRLLLVFLIPLGVFAYFVGFDVGIDNQDLTYHLIRWFREVQDRSLLAISGEFSDYTPPYIYLLWLASFGSGLLSDLTLIKLISLSFTIMASGMVYLILLQFCKSRSTAVAAAFLFLCIPTVVLNGIYWGQCDVIYTFFLLVFFWFSLRRMPSAAACAFGLAFAFKAQSVFLTPYLLYLILNKEFPPSRLLLIPIVYVVMMVPAAFMGRPWSELMTVYLAQADVYHRLSMNAPNLYIFVQQFDLVTYSNGMVISLSISILAGLLVALWGLRLTPTLESKFLVASTSALILPFVLPKMHDRYFFAADIFTFLLAFVLKSGWRTAVLVQLGSVFAYAKFLWGFSLGPSIGAAFMTLAVVSLVRDLFEYRRRTCPQTIVGVTKSPDCG